MDERFDFYNETCANCVYYEETPGHQTWNICRFWIPSSTSINQWAIFPCVGDPTGTSAMKACGCFVRNPFLKEDKPVDANPNAVPISEIGEVQ